MLFLIANFYKIPTPLIIQVLQIACSFVLLHTCPKDFYPSGKTILQSEPPEIYKLPCRFITDYTMKKILLFLLISFASQAIFAQHGITKSEKIIVTDGQKYFLHKVEEGHTLYAISRAYGVSVKSIAKANNRISMKIKTGQTLKIPASASESNAPDFYWHKVTRGQTLYSVAKKFNVSPNDIENYNAGAAQGIHAGQVLKIPNAQKKSVEQEDQNFFYHPVKYGENAVFHFAEIRHNGCPD